MSRLPRLPRRISSDMTSPSRSGSIGGLVTCQTGTLALSRPSPEQLAPASVTTCLESQQTSAAEASAAFSVQLIIRRGSCRRL